VSDQNDGLATRSKSWPPFHISVGWWLGIKKLIRHLAPKRGNHVKSWAAGDVRLTRCAFSRYVRHALVNDGVIPRGVLTADQWGFIGDVSFSKNPTKNQAHQTDAQRQFSSLRTSGTYVMRKHLVFNDFLSLRNFHHQNGPLKAAVTLHAQGSKIVWPISIKSWSLLTNPRLRNYSKSGPTGQRRPGPATIACNTLTAVHWPFEATLNCRALRRRLPCGPIRSFDELR